MSNFWQKLNKPIFCLAPMEEVTDVAFREMFARYSSVGVKSEKLKVKSPNDFVMFTEFINVDGLTHPEGYKKLSIDLKYTEAQRPMVAQIWGTNPDKFFEAAKIIVGMGFDGIDINMGCPQDKEIGIGACAALIRTPELAKQIIEATKKGALLRQGFEGQASGLPVSVKTRIGYTKADEMASWIETLLSCDIAALTIHARTKQEKSKVPAQWGKIAEAVKIRNRLQPIVIARSAADAAISSKTEIASDALAMTRTLIIGNGDIKSRAEGLARVAETGCDGVMIGRGAFGHPWIFRQDDHEPTIKERLSVMLEHASLFEKEFSGIKSFYIMRKHFKAYASGFPDSNELRVKLMLAKDLTETKNIVEEFLGKADFK